MALPVLGQVELDAAGQSMALPALGFLERVITTDMRRQLPVLGILGQVTEAQRRPVGRSAEECSRSRRRAIA